MRELFVEGGMLGYDDQGSGKLVILVPGLGDLRQEYRFLVPRLVAAGYRVVSIDLRGHGDSSVDWSSYSRKSGGADLLALIAHLDAGPAIIVGNSFAAAPAVWAAAERPAAVAAMVLIGPFVLPQPDKPLQRMLIRLLFSGPWKVRAWAWYYGTLFPSRKPDDFAEYVAGLRSNLAQPGRFDAVLAMMLSSEPDIAERLPAVKAPVLVMMGTRDPDFSDPADEARRLAERLHAEVSMIDGAGHYPQSEMPDEAAQSIVEFLARQPRPA
ncbi:MAG: alpha/beta hydrolase [Myxococcales bacterium]|jgi:pimeloyl-ACP methyl ester carboxylesterase